MTRRRWRITLLAAAATLAAIYPITSLFRSSDWLPKAALVIGFVAGVGLLMRGLTRSRVLVLVVQLVVSSYVAVALNAWSTFRLGLPTGRTFDLLGELTKEAIETISRYSVPAPLGEGVTFWLVLAVALVATCVDAMAATWRSPAAAGLPLLTAYLITAANGNAALALRYFVLPVALWLAMLHTSARAQFGRWSTTSATDAHGHDATGDDVSALRSLSLAGAKLGVLGIVVAVALPVLVPHFPPRYLVDGLGRTSTGGTGSVGFNDTVDLERSLNNSDPTPLLRYQTTGVASVPLRVVATSFYSRGQWLPTKRQGAQQTQLPPPGKRVDYVMTVSDNELDAPRVAAPYPVVDYAMDGDVTVDIDPVTRDLQVNQPVSSYRVTYADLAPVAAELRASGEVSSPEVVEDDFRLPASAQDQLKQWSDDVVGTASNPLDKAIAIQNHLRDTSRYTYTLNVAPRERQADGQPVDPVLTFQQTRRGYCVQFASAMIMLARAQGIPARMALGFLPGTRSGDSFIVRNSDAHAWPELYFQGYGWLRFEPTPGGRSGTPPPYTQQGGSGSTNGGRPVDETETTSAPSRSLNEPRDNEPQAGGGSTQQDEGFELLSTRGVAVVGTVLVVLLAVLVMPLTAWIARLRRRRRAANQQELVEIEWDSLTSHLEDLGLSAPAGATLRVQRDRYITDGHLDEESAGAMRRVTATLERARYDRPERTTRDETATLHHDIRSVRRQITGTRARGVRIRSFLWPTAGVSVWRRIMSRRR